MHISHKNLSAPPLLHYLKAIHAYLLDLTRGRSGLMKAKRTALTTSMAAIM